MCLAFAPAASAGNVGYTVTAVLPHDPGAFTQGLLLKDGVFYESTGLYGQSSLRKVDPASGKTLARVNLDQDYFGEGLALWSGKLYQLTWRSRLVLVYDAATLAPLATLSLETEGWGAAATPFGVVTSDGSDLLTWRDPATFRPTRSVQVTDDGRPVVRLNELEWVEGFIMANVWHEDRIAIISPGTGHVVAWLDCSRLRKGLGPLPEESDLNGIAWDPTRKKLYVTGKLWPNIFELTLEGLPKP
jgi:glutamine cyclotransferase